MAFASGQGVTPLVTTSPPSTSESLSLLLSLMFSGCPSAIWMRSIGWTIEGLPRPEYRCRSSVNWRSRYLQLFTKCGNAILSKQACVSRLGHALGYHGSTESINKQLAFLLATNELCCLETCTVKCCSSISFYVVLWL